MAEIGRRKYVYQRSNLLEIQQLEHAGGEDVPLAKISGYVDPASKGRCRRLVNGSHWTEHCTCANVQSGVGDGSNWTKHGKCASDPINYLCKEI